jgi:hypothetical protein
MEKISRILAPSARTKNYDVSRALPARPGAPTIGRPESMDVIEDRMTISDKLIEPIMNGETLPEKKDLVQESYKPRDTFKSQVVKDLTDKFFLKQNPKEIARESDQTQTEEIVSRLQSSTGSSVKPDSSRDANL